MWEDAAEAEYPESPDGWTQRPAAPQAAVQRNRQVSPTTHCLSLLVLHPEMLPDLQAELVALGAGPLDEEDFNQADERAVCAALVTGELDDNRWSGTGRAEDALLTQLQASAQRLPSLPRDQLLEDMLRAVLRLRISNLKGRAKTLPALTRSAREEGQAEDVRSYQQIQQSLSEHLRLLEQLLNQRTHAGRRQMTPNL